MFSISVGSKYFGVAVGGSSGGSNVVRVFNDKNNTLEMKQDRYLSDMLEMLYFSSSNTPYLSCISESTLKIRNLRNDVDIQVSGGKNFSKMTYSTFSELLFIGCDEGLIRVFDVKNDKKEVLCMSSDAGVGKCVGIKSMNGTRVCSLFSDGEVNIWDRNRRVSSFILPEVNPRGIEYSPYGNLIFVTGYENGTLKLHVLDPRSEFPVTSPSSYSNLTIPSSHDFFNGTRYFNTLKLLQNGTLVTSNCSTPNSSLFFFDLRKVKIKPESVKVEEISPNNCEGYVTGIETLNEDQFVLLSKSGVVQVWNSSERRCQNENLLHEDTSRSKESNFSSLAVIPSPPPFIQKMPLISEMDERLEREKVQVICELKTKPLFQGGGLEKDEEEVEGEEDEEEEKEKITLPGLFYIPEGMDERKFYEFKNTVAVVEDTILVRLLLGISSSRMNIPPENIADYYFLFQVQKQRGDVLQRLLSMVDELGTKEILEIAKRIKFLEADPVLTYLILSSQQYARPSAYFRSALEQKVLLKLALSLDTIEKDSSLSDHFQKKGNVEITNRAKELLPFIQADGIPGLERHEDLRSGGVVRSKKDIYRSSNPLAFYTSTFGMGRADVRVSTGKGLKIKISHGSNLKEQEKFQTFITQKRFRKPAHLGVLVNSLYQIIKPILLQLNERQKKEEDLKKGNLVMDKCETELELNMLLDYAYGKPLISPLKMRRYLTRKKFFYSSERQRREYGDVMSSLFKFFWMAHSVGDTKMVLDVMLIISFMSKAVNERKMFEWFMLEDKGIPTLASLFGSVYDEKVAWIMQQFRPLFYEDDNCHVKNTMVDSMSRIGRLFFEYIVKHSN